MTPRVPRDPLNKSKLHGAQILPNRQIQMTHEVIYYKVALFQFGRNLRDRPVNKYILPSVLDNSSPFWPMDFVYQFGDP